MPRLTSPTLIAAEPFTWSTITRAQSCLHISQGAWDSGLWYHKDESPERSSQGNAKTEEKRQNFQGSDRWNLELYQVHGPQRSQDPDHSALGHHCIIDWQDQSSN
ncbi:hypothetical protein PoB_006730600 [Plakobranchus ocellatus]|uniref:Uncharacterized protein n=1 Tax=Plakobranchus ocellatus TaxID=259542 RepID=A0AAV4DA45_9GAST|nr:hypothetical protein PoB_006730600 [Plakobranchus ocellatus]